MKRHTFIYREDTEDFLNLEFVIRAIDTMHPREDRRIIHVDDGRIIGTDDRRLHTAHSPEKLVPGNYKIMAHDKNVIVIEKNTNSTYVDYKRVIFEKLEPIKEICLAYGRTTKPRTCDISIAMYRIIKICNHPIDMRYLTDLRGSDWNICAENNNGISVRFDSISGDRLAIIATLDPDS
jgi:hypothetical protein